MLYEAIGTLKLKDRTDVGKQYPEQTAIAPLVPAITAPSDTSDKKSPTFLREVSQ